MECKTSTEVLVRNLFYLPLHSDADTSDLRRRCSAVRRPTKARQGENRYFRRSLVNGLAFDPGEGYPAVGLGTSAAGRIASHRSGSRKQRRLRDIRVVQGVCEKLIWATRFTVMQYIMKKSGYKVIIYRLAPVCDLEKQLIRSRINVGRSDGCKCNRLHPRVRCPFCLPADAPI